MQIEYWKNSPGNESKHYDGTIQPIDLILSQKLSFVEGSIVKYICRYKKKDKILDLKKALWYLALLLCEYGSPQDLKESIQILINTQKEKIEPQEIQQSNR